MWNAILKIFQTLFKLLKTNYLSTTLKNKMLKLLKYKSPKKVLYELLNPKSNKTTIKEREKIKTVIKKDPRTKKIQEQLENKINEELITHQAETPKAKEMIDWYDKLFLSEEKVDIKREARKISAKYDEEDDMWYKSSWIFGCWYFPKSKQCMVQMKNKFYWFYKVPRSKYIILKATGGRYMWDYFGKHYSLNKRKWIRKRER